MLESFLIYDCNKLISCLNVFFEGKNNVWKLGGLLKYFINTHIHTHTHVPRWIGPLPLSCSSAITQQVSRGECASSNAGQHHCRVTARHHTGERVRHGYVVWDYLVKGQRAEVTLHHPQVC